MPQISSVNMGQVIPYTENNLPLFSPFSGIQISNSGDPLVATLTMDGNAQVDYGPGIGITNQPLTLTKAQYSTPAESAAAVQAALRQIEVAPLDPNGGANIKYGYQDNITMYLTVTDVVTNQAQTITINDTEDPPPSNPHAVVSSGQSVVVPIGMDTAGTTINNGGYVTNDGTLNSATITAGGVLANDGIVSQTVIETGGLLTEQWTAQDYGTIITAGGEEEIYNGSPGYGSHDAIIDKGGIQSVYGAYTFNPTVNSGGQLLVSGGNIIETYSNAGQSYGAVINSGGTEIVSSSIPNSQYGIANGTIVEKGGVLGVHSGGESINAAVYSGGTLNNDATTIGTTLNGTMNDNAGGIAQDTSAGGGGTLNVWNGGLAQSTILYSGGTEAVNGGGKSTGTTIGSGGFEGVWGDTTGNTIYAGGKMAVYNGGVDHGTWIGSGGIEFIRAGGVEAGTVTFGGANAEFGLQTAASGYWSATVAGFTKGDSVDFANMGFAKTEAKAFSGGVLYLANGSQHAALAFSGSYATGSFALSNDGAGGTLVTHT